MSAKTDLLIEAARAYEKASRDYVLSDPVRDRARMSLFKDGFREALTALEGAALEYVQSEAKSCETLPLVHAATGDTLDVEVKIPIARLRKEALQAGCRYWAKALEWQNPDGTKRDDVSGFPTHVVEHNDSRDPERHVTHALDWPRAVRLAIADYPHIFDEARSDALTGDLWVQLAAFGEVRYG